MLGLLIVGGMVGLYIVLKRMEINEFGRIPKTKGKVEKGDYAEIRRKIIELERV